MDLDAMERKLTNVRKNLNDEEVKLTNLTQKIYLNDITNVSIDSLEDDNQKHYLLMKKKYLNLINQFSISYLEMSDWYIGEDLSYQEYCKIFDQNIYENSTYLDSKKDVQELYSLFLFYSMFSLHLNNTSKE